MFVRVLTSNTTLGKILIIIKPMVKSIFHGVKVVFPHKLTLLEIFSTEYKNVKTWRLSEQN